MDITLNKQDIKTLLSDTIRHTPPSFIKNILKTAGDPSIISFAGGMPNPISFPEKELQESMKRIMANYGSRCFQYSLTEGLPEFRQHIANKYNKDFGLNLTIDNVMISTGSQQALDLIGKIFIDKGDEIILEKPSYLGAIQAFAQYQPKFHQVELTDEGMDIEEFKSVLNNRTKFIYTIPDFQNPTGLSYSAKTRNTITNILKDKNTILVEDDPYGELRFDGERLPYMGVGKLKNSIVLGTYSKTISPGMRVGYVISENTEIIEKLTVAKEASDLHSNIFNQYLIWDYLTHNDMQEHISKIKALYKKQATAMVNAMATYFPRDIKYTIPHGGMFLWVTLPEGVSAMNMFSKAIEEHITYVPGDPFYVGMKDVNAMRLNYTNADCKTIDEGIKRLGKLIRETI